MEIKMNFFTTIKNFAADESGAVTVDWVVLTAAIVGLGVALIGTISTSVDNLGDRIAAEIDLTLPD